MKFNLINTIKNTPIISKSTFALKKASPQITLAMGITFLIGAGVTACFATRKLDKIIDEHKGKLEEIANFKERYPQYADQYSEEDAQKDVKLTYGKTALRIAKLYSLPVLLAAIGVGCTLSSHVIMKNRLSAMSAAYVGLNETFKRYRNNVKERYGEEVDNDLRNGVKAEKIVEKITDENGNEKEVEKEKKTDPSILDNDTSRLWDPRFTCEYEGDPEISWAKLQCEQDYFNTLLRTRGYVFLNEVYHRLGYDETKQGQCLGWIYDKNSNDCNNYIIFLNGDPSAYLRGEEKLVLHFNVDGNILDKDPFHEAYAKLNK